MREALKPTIWYVFYQRGHCHIFCGAFEKYDHAEAHIKSYVERNAHPRIWLGENDFFIEAHTLGCWVLEDLEDGNT